MKKIIKRSAIAVLFVAFGVACVLFYPFSESDKNVSIEVQYMRYACGPCYVQMKIVRASNRNGVLVSKAEPGEENSSPLRFVGTDIMVYYKRNWEAIDEYISRLDEADNEHCLAPPEFRLKGQLKRKIILSLVNSGDHYDGLYFDADSIEVVNDARPTCRKIEKNMSF